MFALLVASFGSSAADEVPIEFQLPVDCEIGATCFVQNLVDHDPGSGATDYMCGQLTYDGHDGTDFRVPDLRIAATVKVLAAAAGRVVRARDGVADVSVHEVSGDAVRNKECGNGLVIEHGDDWETQYCHLAEGSLSAEPGDRVSPGEAIGLVGLSGMTEFAHLHFTVRHNSEIVDPFAIDRTVGQCGPGRVLWSAAVAAKLPYAPGFILNAGFASRRLSMAEIEAGILSDFALTESAPVLAAVVRAGGLRAGDVVEMTLSGPDGEILVKKRPQPLPGAMAQHMVMIGRKRPAPGWARGRYVALYRLMRNGNSVVEKHFSLDY
jgi:hypothetical protein